MQRLAEQNAKDAAAQLTSRSETMAKLAAGGKLNVVYAMHDAASGEVSWHG